MNIGQAANASGVSAKMIRHYEEIGLIAKANRSESGYRIYTERDVHILQFIHHARNLGFSIGQIKNLLSLWLNKRRTSRKVKELAMDYIEELDERITELNEIRQVISHLVEHCHGDDRPDCPILEGLANGNHGRQNRSSHLKNHHK